MLDVLFLFFFLRPYRQLDLFWISVSSSRDITSLLTAVSHESFIHAFKYTRNTTNRIPYAGTTVFDSNMKQDFRLSYIFVLAWR